MAALPDTGVTASVVMASIMLGVLTLSGAVFVVMVFGNPFGHWRRKRRHRRESTYHPERYCHFCHGTSTRLVKHTVSTGTVISAPWTITYRCKDRNLCEATRELKRLLDSPS